MQQQMSGGRRGIVISCDKCPPERWRCIPLLGPLTGKGMKQTPLQTDSAVFCYAYTDKTTTARPGLQLDFGLNVVGNESVTRFDWNLCSALTDPDHGFYWSTRIVATMLWLIAIMIQIEHSPRRHAVSILGIGTIAPVVSCYLVSPPWTVSS